MNRRDFNARLAAAGAFGALGTTLGGLAQAQAEPAEGREYTRIKEPVPVAVPGKVEVIEFFGYWCPHCAALEPTLEAWARKLPADVNFRRLPVAFSAPQESYQKLYFALEAMGQVAAMHGKVFTAMHGARQRLDKDAEITALAAASGVDGAKLLDTMKSFTVATKASQARQLSQTYRIEGVPTLIVHGRYMTSVGMAGTADRALQVVDALIQRSRASR
ncbi:thiol:disulfide interchange protein DsbA/DsbL [Ideonella sp. A 288]|uniref:thiol:disulfide interchange protein DsbA/DsbL n=1 Tax=Ideonella sp. A 288 TaxID=1962181 RepID=UPI000B4AADD5|nr:thiol:disulfide interchange protein DsbA/DsbL [Ideonella sp. A 288]